MVTYKKYIDFCEIICRTGIPQYNVMEYLNIYKQSKQQCIIIKHDVEDKPIKALEIANIESKYGIKATYYIHSYFLKNPSYIKIFLKIQSLGHEIGYHFDVLDNNDGIYQKAKNEFIEALFMFKNSGFNVKTVCPHGNPLKIRVGYSSNKDFLQDENIRKNFTNIVDVYNDLPHIVDREYLYLSDAGYAYKYCVANNKDSYRTEKWTSIQGLEEINNLIEAGKSMLISIHTHRYCRNKYVARTKIVVFRVAKTIANALFRTKLGQVFINKFFFLARKI